MWLRDALEARAYSMYGIRTAIRGYIYEDISLWEINGSSSSSWEDELREKVAPSECLMVSLIYFRTNDGGQNPKCDTRSWSTI